MTALVRPIPIDQLDRRADARAVNADQVLAIATSMADVGQINPIRVRPVPGTGERFEIVAGVHRVEACRSLGLVEVEALIVDSGELFAELAMIDENLCRAELGPADRARQTARRKAIYEELHPETAHGVAGGRARQGSAGDNLSFADATAELTGRDARTVQRDAARGERIRDEALDAVAGTDLDTGVFLDELKQVDPDEQLGVVRQRLNGERARQAVGAGRVQAGDSLDYFPTPPWATRALLEDVFATKGIDIGFDLVWEPACGEGHISGVLEEYDIQVIATDIHDYSADGRSPPGWVQAADFLNATWGEDRPPEWIITNPPFTGRGMDRALEFALRALDIASRGVALFVRAGWAMEGIERYERLFRDRPPLYVCPFTERVPVHEGRWEPDGSTDMCYAWLVWLKGDSAPRGPVSFVERIPPGRRQALSRPDDVARFTAHPVRRPADQQVSPSGAAPAAGDAGEADPARNLQPASPASSLPSQAAAEGEGDGVTAPAGEVVAPDASPARLSFAEARPILEARYRTTPGAVLEAETGVPVNTLRSWARKLGLASVERRTAELVARTRARNAAGEAGHG